MMFNNPQRGPLGLLISAVLGVLLSACGAVPGQISAPQEFSSSADDEPRAQPASTGGGIFVVSIEENGYAHLFAFQPPSVPLTRLTFGEWNDTAPAPSPDGNRIAFASDRGGSWDLYTSDLQNGAIVQLTTSSEYDSAPTWSPDGQWIAFESYVDDNLELVIVPTTPSAEPPIRLTENGAADHSPAWSPDGRRIAFISTRGGGSDVWLADLDAVGDGRFMNLSSTPSAVERYPAWSADGSRLLWTALAPSGDFSGVYVADAQDPETGPRWIGDGARAAWGSGDSEVVAAFVGANENLLTSYGIDGSLRLPPIRLPGAVRGLAWSPIDLPTRLASSIASAAAGTPGPLWAPAVTPAAVPSQRWYLVPVEGIQAPVPQLHDLVDESFRALRQRIVDEAGWDALANLENAFVPLTTALEPGLQEDWLYTGRGFAINSLMLNAGWMIAVREDIGAQTYWRLYIRCTRQDGSLGEPIHDSPWDLAARYDLDPVSYEQGGRLGPVPPGYWVDVTALASAYGWERVSALPNWRSFFGGARFTEFVLTGGMDWYHAMLELYPADALVTPTRVLPPTNTPTRTPLPTSTPRPTRTPRPTLTPSLTPTSTPIPPPTATPPTVIP